MSSQTTLDSSKPFSVAERYSRQVLFAGIGAEGQRRLATAHVAIAGCGATGAAAATLLARAGVGTLTLIDRDFVEESNLQRQMLFNEDDAVAALPKAEAGRRQIALFNSSIRVNARVADLVPGNIHELLRGADLVLDGTDNFETRYLINDYSVEQNVPWVYAAALGSYAATMNVLPGETGCLACIFPARPAGAVETCDTAGILGSAVTFAASIQASEAIKFLVGAKDRMRKSLLALDVWSNEHSEVSNAVRRAGCESCDKRNFLYLEGAGHPHITLCGRNSVQIHEHHRPVDFAAMHKSLEAYGKVRHNDMLLRFERGEHVITIFPDGRTLIQGTTNISLARSLYTRFVGS